MAPVPPSVAQALADSLKAAPALPADRAAVALAETLAAELDAGGDVVKLSPPFLAVLTSLGLTPAARAAVKGGAQGDGGESRAVDALARLRERRGAR